MKRIRKPLLIFAIFVLITLPLSVPRMVRIRNIECFNQYGKCRNDLTEELSILENKTYAYSNAYLRNKFQKDPSITGYKTYYKVPGRLVVEVSEKKPSFSVTGNDKKIYSIIDSDGNVINTSTESNLPSLVNFNDLPQKGSKVDSKTLFALKIMKDIFTVYQVNEGRLENDSLVIELRDGIRVIFPLEGEREVLIGSLILLHGEITGKGESTFEKVDGRIKQIDLRFKNPILKTG